MALPYLCQWQQSGENIWELLLNVAYRILSYLPKIACVLVKKMEMPKIHINKYGVFLTNTGLSVTPYTVVFNLGKLKRE